MTRLNCERYPCHFPHQDCTFCFCPFYPCMDDRTGGLLQGGEWCCHKCTIVHRPEVAEIVMDGLMAAEDLKVIWARVARVL